MLFQLNIFINNEVVPLSSLQCFSKYGYLEVLNTQLQENTGLYQGKEGRLHLETLGQLCLEATMP